MSVFICECYKFYIDASIPDWNNGYKDVSKTDRDDGYTDACIPE
jgi:hypothetical protein